MRRSKNSENNRIFKHALTFILLMGLVSMFADMTHEGAKSIYGAYLALAGAQAATIGFVTGLGEFIGYSLRLVTGIFADRKKNYWVMTIIGYLFNMCAIPALALVPENGWIFACILIIIERIGKAIRHPAKNTLVSFAASQLGPGRSFAIQEFLDQLGAFIGPVIMFVVLLLSKGKTEFAKYAVCFAILGVPALITILVLLMAKKKYPEPENMELSVECGTVKKSTRPFILYIIAISLLALGFTDFPLVTMHVYKQSLIPSETLPLLYAGAMAADAFAALLFGWLYDRWGIKLLMLSTALSLFFPVLIFGTDNFVLTAAGIILWGIGMGAQESIMKSAVCTIVPKERRSTGFGVSTAVFGLFWFLGSWSMGALYDISPVWLIIFSVFAQILAIPFFYASWKAGGKNV
jgi:MFS family permease